jgi:hypothetical protein
MNKFDQVINEAGIGNMITNTAASLGRIGNIASKAATSPSLQPIKDLFTKTKSKLEHVTVDTAKKSVGGVIGGLRQIGSKIALGFRPKFSINSVIIDEMGYEGLVGKIIKYNDPLINKFEEKIKNVFNLKGLRESAEKSGRFWVVISPKGNATVDTVRQQNQEGQQQTTGVSGFRKGLGGIVSNLGNKLAGESYFNELVNDYSPNLILEQTNLIPSNTMDYTSHFIYESQIPANVGKFYILPSGAKPNTRIGKTFPLTNEIKGLVLVGNKTEYPFWYFLNDFEKAEYEDSEQKLQKQGITTRRYGSGYDIEEPTVAPQSTPTQGDIQGK